MFDKDFYLASAAYRESSIVGIDNWWTVANQYRMDAAFLDKFQ